MQIVLHQLVKSDFKKEAKEGYSYDATGYNSLSAKQINVINFVAPIKNIYQPPGQNIAISQDSYLNNNKSVAFILNPLNYNNNVQLVVTLDNGHPPVTLTFHPEDVNGQTINVSALITGPANLKKTGDVKVPAYEQAMMDITKKAFQGNLGASWQNKGSISCGQNAGAFNYFVNSYVCQSDQTKLFKPTSFSLYSSMSYDLLLMRGCSAINRLTLSSAAFHHDPKDMVITIAHPLSVGNEVVLHEGDCTQVAIIQS